MAAIKPKLATSRQATSRQATSKRLTRVLMVGLLVSLSALAFAENMTSKPKLSLEQSYLSYWFSIDTSNAINVQIIGDAKGVNQPAALKFTSDDAYMVNGKIAYPATDTTPAKLAFVLHPMGSSQDFWWSKKSPLGAHSLTDRLLGLGYTVISLDARGHGSRKVDGLSARDLITKARSLEPRVYIDTIIGSVRDYRTALHWARKTFQPSQVLVVGYSMGAQMALLLASYESSVDAVLAMVPPYVASPTSPVAPRVHLDRIQKANVLWLAGKDDPYSNKHETEHAFKAISSSNKKITWFDAGHRLPDTYQIAAMDFFESLQERGK